MFYRVQDRKKILDSVENISNDIKSIDGNECLNNLTNTLSKDSTQNLIYILSEKDHGVDNTLLRIIVRSFLISESISSGSADLAVSLLSYYLEDFKKFKSNQERLSRIKDLREEIILSSKILKDRTKKANIEDLRLVIKGMGFSLDINKILYDLILNGDLNTAYDVSKSSSGESYYQDNLGNELKISIPQVNLIKSGVWKRNSVNTILIDGIVETVSQIHHVLEKSSSQKSPMLIFCRQASEEVRKTVDLNFMRGTLDLLMVETGFGVEYHHIFEDFSVALNCDYVNIKMGDTVSSKMEKLNFIIDDVIAANGSINLRINSTVEDSMLNYINDIKDIKNTIVYEKMEKDDLLNVIKSIDSRIKFLSSKRIDIKIGKSDIDSDPYLISKIDKLFRSFADIGLTGIVDLRNHDDTEARIIKVLSESISQSIFTQRQIFQSLLTSFKVYETLIKAEKIFTIDDS